MKMPEPHCMTLLFRFAFQVESFLPNFSLFLFILSVRRSVSSAHVPDNATQLAMCLGRLCTDLKTCGQRRTSSVYQIQDGGQNTFHAALTKYARSEALTRHCRFTVMFYGFWMFSEDISRAKVWAYVFWLNDARVCFVRQLHATQTTIAACSVKNLRVSRCYVLELAWKRGRTNFCFIL